MKTYSIPMVQKNLNQTGYLLSLIPGFLVIYGNIRGEYWTGLNVFFTLFILVLLDWFVPEDKSHPGDTSDFYGNFILTAHVFLNTLAISSLIYGVFNDIISGYFIFLAILSTGINSGMSGIIVAHELIHRKNKILRMMGLWNLLLVNYLHWYIEHRYGHHKWVGTLKDPATARYGESIYHFVIRTIPQQFVSAFTIEWNRQKQKENSPIGPTNFVINGIFSHIVFWVFILVIFNFQIWLIFMGQAMIAVVLLELVNYIEHYGLLRTEDKPVDIEISWQTDAVSSRYFLLELPRHSDHHMKPYKPFVDLISHDGSPVLPAGYWGNFFLVFFPPLWYRLIHPRIPPKMVDLYYELTSAD